LLLLAVVVGGLAVVSQRMGIREEQEAAAQRTPQGVSS
jgi:hypothetical protein